MNGVLAIAALLVVSGVSFFIPQYGPSALFLCGLCAAPVMLLIQKSESDRRFLHRVFAAALLLRLILGTAIFHWQLQNFFGGDALTYDELGNLLAQSWAGSLSHVHTDEILGQFLSRNWGMTYLVAAVYSTVGRNMLAVQFVNSVLGATTAPLIFLCAQHIFSNNRVARVTAIGVAFYPSLVLWSSQGLKDGPIVFLLTLIMLATFRLGERFNFKYASILGVALFSLLSLRFYIFYMAVAAVAGAFIVGLRRHSAESILRQFVAVIIVGLMLMYAGVLRTATSQLELYGSLERVQISRADMASSAQSGFGGDVDVSTTRGALIIIPMGLIYLLFAPFPWQLANLRQLITLPEMVVWWASFPALVIGAWFTVRFKLRRALPILLFTVMLTLAYSVFQGNVGTAYRQRSQLLVFYFMFVAVGWVLIKEKRESRQQEMLMKQRPKQISRMPQAIPARGPRLPVKRDEHTEDAIQIRSASTGSS